MPIASRTVAPNASSISSRVAGSPPPGSPATASWRIPRLDGVDVARAAPVGEVDRVGGRAAERLRPEDLEGPDEPLGVAAADRDHGRPDAGPGVEHHAGDERPRVVGEDRALPGLDPAGAVGARADLGPAGEVGVGDGDVERVAGRPAGREDPPHGLGRRREVAAERRLGGERGAQLLLRRERQGREVVEAAGLGARELVAVERRALAQRGELVAQRRLVARPLLGGVARLDVGGVQAHPPS